jgi:hypothetical protein
LIIDGPGSSTFSGTISGPGSLAIDGGSLTLTGAGSHIGGDLDIGACGCSASTLKLVSDGFAQHHTRLCSLGERSETWPR